MKTVYSCVVDADPKYARQTLLWAASLLIHGGQEAESLVVHTIGERDPRLHEILDSWGVEQVAAEPFDARHPYSNKLVQFATPSLRNADFAVLCDCDLAFAASVARWTRGQRIRARIADRPWLPLEQWRAIFEAADLMLPRGRVLAGNGAPTLPSFCNGGLYMVPRQLFAPIGDLWCRWDRWLLDHAELLGSRTIFADQVSFALACEDLGYRIDYLPIELNFHTGKSPAALLRRDRRPGLVPIVLHYHDLVGPRGFLFKEKVPSMNAATERINRLVRDLNELYPIEQGAQDPIEQGAQDPIEQGAQDPIEQGAQDPIEQGAQDPIEQGAQDPIEQGAQDPIEQGAQDPIEQGAQDSR